MTTLHITVGDRESLREEALEFVEAGDTGDLDADDSRAVLQFGGYDDLTENLTLLRLALLGILTFGEGGPTGAMRPVVPFDRIEMRVDYPLVEPDVGDSTVSA